MTGHEVDVLIARVRRLTPAQAEALAAAYTHAIRLIVVDTAWLGASLRVRLTILGSGRTRAMLVAHERIRRAMPRAPAAAVKAVLAAADAMIARDLISDADYRTLTAPWADTIGPPAPDLRVVR